MDVLIIVFAILVIGSVVFAIMFSNYLKSVISLAAASVFLSVILFLLGLPWAAVIELSLSGGLVSLIILRTTALENNEGKKPAKIKKKGQIKLLILPVSLGLIGVIAIAALTTGETLITFTQVMASTFESFGNLLFNSRQVDIFALIILLIAGGLAGVFLFKECEE